MDHQLLEKYFRGQCTDREKAEIEKWLTQEEELPEAGFSAPDTVMRHEWASIQYRIGRSTHLARLKKAVGIAAGVCLLVATGFFWRYQQQHTQPAAIAWKTMQVPNGRKAQLLLSDGSSIHLNGGTSIAYAEPFDNNRTIKFLEGEAFFDIATDSRHPFSVQTAGGGIVKVLGTRFNIKHSSFPDNLQFTLNSGRISFSQDQKTIYMKPGEQLTYDLLSHTIHTPSIIDTLKAVSWRQGMLLFRNTPVRQVFTELEQYFGVKFIIDKKIENQLFTAELNHETLPAILRLMELSSDLRFKVDGQTIRVY